MPEASGVPTVWSKPIDARRLEATARPPERQLESARARAGEGRKAQAEIARLQAALDEARAELADAVRLSAEARAACDESCGCRRSHPPTTSDPAVRLVDAAVSAMLVRPPAGMDLAYVANFARRNRAALVGMVQAAIDRRSARLGGTP